MEKVTKTIEVFKHPYKWEVEVEFGTIEEMLKNCHRVGAWDGIEVLVGGSFNKKMDSGSRAPLCQVGVQLDVETYGTENGVFSVSGVKSAKGIRKNSWEGTYCYNKSLFDSMLEQGLYPVRANWDGKTYIERGKLDKDGNWKSWYELTDRYVY